MRPIIGVGSYPRLVETAFGSTLLQTASRFYIGAIEHAGGVPVILPVTEPDRVGDVLRLVHGLVLTGGGDVAPSLYGATPLDGTTGVDPERDAFEVALCRAAIDSGVPILAICRGMQVMNVVLGGTLVQDIAAVTGQYHYDPRRWREQVHRIKVEPQSRVAGALGETELGVNTVHHQGLDRLAEGVRAVAWAEDGSVEAIEIPGAPFVVGVQWHPEVLEDHPEQRGLFRHLVDHARRYAAPA